MFYVNFHTKQNITVVKINNYLYVLELWVHNSLTYVMFLLDILYSYVPSKATDWATG